jgi:hypothetical protein
MKFKYKCSYLDATVYAQLVLGRLLGIIKMDYHRKLDDVPLNERTNQKFFELYYAYAHRCIKACLNAGRKYPFCQAVTLRYMLIYTKKLEEAYSDSAVNDAKG